MKYIFFFISFAISYQLGLSQKYSIEERAALLNLNGYNVTNHNTFNDRLFQKHKIEKLMKNPETIILGSSRVRGLDEVTLGKGEIINNGISKATIKDLISIYHIYRVNGFKPKEIYLGTDPLIVDSISHDLWKFLEKDYDNMYDIMFNKDDIRKHLPSKFPRKRIPKIEKIYDLKQYRFTSRNFANDSVLVAVCDSVSKDIENNIYYPKMKIDFLNELLTTSSLYDSLQRKRDIILNTTGQCLVYETNAYRFKKFSELKYYQKNNIMKVNRIILELIYNCPASNSEGDFPTLNDHNLTMTNLKNGSTTYGYEMEHRSVKQIDETIPVEKSDDVPEKPYSKLFEMFIDFLLSEDIKINFILAPVHPLAYQTNEKYFSDREKYLLDVAKKRGIRIYGSFNANVIGLESSDFYDSVHVRNKSFKKVFVN